MLRLGIVIEYLLSSSKKDDGGWLKYKDNLMHRQPYSTTTMKCQKQLDMGKAQYICEYWKRGKLLFTGINYKEKRGVVKLTIAT
jgi:hypothetical protein